MIRHVIMLTLVSGTVGLSAQVASPGPSTPTFEVASIREHPPGQPRFVVPTGWTPVQPGGRYVSPDTTVAHLILFAYDVVLPGETLLPSLPEWAMRTRYAVSAAVGDEYPTLSPDENRRRVQLMVRELLKDRFRLRLHTETRQKPILKMSLEPGQLRLKEVPPPAVPQQIGLSMGDRGGRIIGTRTMADFARSAGVLLRQVVVDETGLPGYFDMNFRWTAPVSPGEPLPQAALGPAGMALFLTAMKDQFGLRFTGATGNVEYWVVDQVEPPSTG